MEVINLPARGLPVQLVEEFGDAVYKFCRSLTFSKEEAEDLFQDTFLQAFEQLAKLQAAENPRSFLFSTAVFVWKSRKRKYARRKRLAPAEQLDEAAASDENPEESS